MNNDVSIFSNKLIPNVEYRVVIYVICIFFQSFVYLREIYFYFCSRFFVLIYESEA